MKPTLFLGTDAAGRRVHIPIEQINHAGFLGASGLGKSKLLQHIVRQIWRWDLAGHRYGSIFIDPHGDAVAELLADAAHMGLGSRLVVFDPGPVWCPTLNPLGERYGNADGASLTLRAVQKACRDQDPDQMPRLQRHLRAVIRVLQAAGLTLVEAYDFLVDPNVRKHLVQQLSDSQLRAFWERFDQDLSPNTRNERIESTENRIDRIVASSPIMRQVLGAAESSIDIGRIMDEGKHLLVNLGHENLTQEQRSLLGSLLVETIFQTAVRRPKGRRKPCYVIIDEAADFLTGDEDLPRALAQTRKFGVHFFLALQMLAQLEEQHRILKSAVLTNCNLRCAFGGSREDADILAGELFTGAFHQDEIKHEDFATKFRPVESTRTIRAVSHGSASGSAFGTMSSGVSSSGTFSHPEFGVTGMSSADAWTDADSEVSSHSDIAMESTAIVPFVEAHEFLERTGVQFRTPAELRERYTALVKCQPERHFLMQFGHHRQAIGLVTPDIRTYTLTAPGRRRFLRQIFVRTGCMRQIEALERESAVLRRALFVRLDVTVTTVGPKKGRPTRRLRLGPSPTDQAIEAARRNRGHSPDAS